MSETGSYFRTNVLILILVVLFSPVSGDFLLAQSGSVAVVTNRYANIRSGPGTQYTRLGRVYAGNRFPVLSVQDDWVEISYSGRDAWIFATLVELEEAGPSQAEIDMVEIKVNDLNNRLEGLMQKLEQVTEAVDQRMPEQPEVEPVVKNKVTPMRKLPPAERVSPAWVFIPGGPRLAAGDRLRGYGLLGVTLACAGAGYYFYDQYKGYKDDYNALDSGASPDEFNALIDKANSRRRVSNAMIYAAAGMYALNVADYFYFLPRSMAGMQVNAAPAGGGKINLSLSREF
jgi:hypothetical protein